MARSWRGWRAWWLLFGAAGVTAAASVVSSSLPAAVASSLLAIAGAVLGVQSLRSATVLDSEAERRQQARDELLTGPHGRLPKVSEITDPILLGVHRAARVPGSTVDSLPVFVRRDRSSDVEHALRDGTFVLVTGESTSGKSRAAFEAMRARLPNYAIVRPASRAAVRSVLLATQRERRCVVWLDDLERYLGAGGMTAHLLYKMLRGRHVVVLATMRVQERARYATRFDGPIDATDRSANEGMLSGREILDLATEIRLHRRWSRAELDRAGLFIHDPRISDALDRADEFGIAEYVAAGPQLLEEWHDAWAPGSHPRGAALIAAAIDARRAGCLSPVPLDLLHELHEHYLRERGGARLRPEPWDEAVAWAVEPLHATTSLLIGDDNDMYSAFDYLLDVVDSTGESPPVPDATWQVLIDRSSPARLADIGWAAYRRSRLEYAESALRRAFDHGLSE